MKKTAFFLMLFILTTSLSSWAKSTLRFKDGKFKIAQFTDIHWSQNSTNCVTNEQMIRTVMAAEQPDLIVLTGDIVTEQPAEEGWQSIIRIMESMQKPFIFVPGNHDGEVMNKERIFQLLTASPYYIGERGPRNIYGYGNCVLTISPSLCTEDNTAAVLYFIDSNDYPAKKEWGTYDKIHFDELLWYRTMSDYFTKQNQGKALPALAFFHIPLPEYHEVVNNKQYLGSYDEGEICSPQINSGLFSSFIDQKDVMATFCGHDHENDFIGLLHDIALAYGRNGGLDTYGKKEKGARIIQLYEGERKFDSWIRTTKGCEDTFYYPSGLTSKDEKDITYLPAVNIKPKRQGVAYTYYEGNAKHTDDIPNIKLIKQGVMPNFAIDQAPQEDHFAYVFRALIQIEKRGVYRFYTYSDDGSKLLIDGQVIVDNDGGHSARRAEGKVGLEAGFHEIELRYFENYMGQSLEVGYTSKDVTDRIIPSNMLFLPTDK